MNLEQLLTMLGLHPHDATDVNGDVIGRYDRARLDRRLRLDLGLIGLSEHAGDVVATLISDLEREEPFGKGPSNHPSDEEV